MKRMSMLKYIRDTALRGLSGHRPIKPPRFDPERKLAKAVLKDVDEAAIEHDELGSVGNDDGHLERRRRRPEKGRVGHEV
jgi:hypothetical protein